MPQTLDALLNRLEASKSRFGGSASAEIRSLLEQISRHDFRDAKQLLRFHETLLFLRAFPHSSSLLSPIEKLLNRFHERVEKLRALGADMSFFDDFDTSGIAGTTMQDALNFEAARWLARRIPQNVEIAWNDFWDDAQAERAVGATWPRFIPLLEEDAAVEANIPWRRWLDTARGRERDLAWLIRRFEELRVSHDEIEDVNARAELYDSLHLPLRWHLRNLKFSRTRNWSRPRRLFIHRERLIARSQVSLVRELSKAGPRLTRLSRREGESVINTIREVMAVRYRELYGTTRGDPNSVVRADLGSGEDGRGIVIHLWNLPAGCRLPLRAYVAGFTLKNGVPINYIEAIGLCDWIEVGFNTFYTYRQGETAWIYAQALRCLRAFTGATTISVYPYQIGQNNDEALDSGAFWFYRKLGFRSGRADLERLARKEEQKIAADPQYRTPRRILKRLAEAHVFYELPPTGKNATSSRAEEAGKKQLTAAQIRPSATLPLTASGRLSTTAEVRPFQGRIQRAIVEELPFKDRIQRAIVEERTFQGRVQGANKEPGFSPGAPAPGPWDTFSTRNLALRVNRRMAREFDGDVRRIREASVKQVTRALHLNPSRWTPPERRPLENWSLVLALIPDLARWSAAEKQDLIRIIRSQSGPDEIRYLHLTQRHHRLRGALLRLGSKSKSDA